LVRKLGFAFLMLWPGVAGADVGVGLRKVPVHVTLTVDRDYPEFVVYILPPAFEKGDVRRVLPTASEPAAVDFDGGREWHFVRDVFVVPRFELAKFDGSAPPPEWFRQKGHEKYAAGLIKARSSLDVFDNRRRVEQSYRLERTGDGFQLVLVAENRGDRWVEWTWTGICCVLPPVACSATIALVGLWLVRRGNRKRRAGPGPP
jgi:hypothetical protein